MLATSFSSVSLCCSDETQIHWQISKFSEEISILKAEIKKVPEIISFTKLETYFSFKFLRLHIAINLSALNIPLNPLHGSANSKVFSTHDLIDWIRCACL